MLIAPVRSCSGIPPATDDDSWWCDKGVHPRMRCIPPFSRPESQRKSLPPIVAIHETSTRRMAVIKATQTLSSVRTSLTKTLAHTDFAACSLCCVQWLCQRTVLTSFATINDAHICSCHTYELRRCGCGCFQCPHAGLLDRAVGCAKRHPPACIATTAHPCVKPNHARAKLVSTR